MSEVKEARDSIGTCEEKAAQMLKPAFERLCEMAMQYRDRDDREGQEQYRKFCDTILDYYKAICWRR